MLYAGMPMASLTFLRLWNMTLIIIERYLFVRLIFMLIYKFLLITAIKGDFSRKCMYVYGCVRVYQLLMWECVCVFVLMDNYEVKGIFIDLSLMKGVNLWYNAITFSMATHILAHSLTHSLTINGHYSTMTIFNFLSIMTITTTIITFLDSFWRQANKLCWYAGWRMMSECVCVPASLHMPSTISQAYGCRAEANKQEAPSKGSVGTIQFWLITNQTIKQLR